MLPLSAFLLAWIIFLGLYAVMSLLSLMCMLRYGVLGLGTSFSVLLFLAIVALSLFVTIPSLTNIDWSQSLNVLEVLNSSPIF